ncbi:hypothetical protein [Dickeya solani]|jgi:hypothetical protein|nr:hypothetical protein [Dickeya solani]MCZ0784554.1 hypothetical protein [Dickeya solani]MCZ0799256.1 hypothetical protein [Dickeya solani]MCZ0804737.1 hypothetical protein [Dickeya solani]MDV7006812.1 hypothetical protein [Dickeya solani]WBV94503.1 hypothetical protein OQ520_17930 [Dickeya solani]
MRKKMIIIFFVLGVPIAYFIISNSGLEHQFSSSDNSSLTDPIIINAPKISQKYQIKHGDAEGPGKQVTGIYFENTTDIETLRNYLKLLKFTLNMDDGYREVWESPDKNKFIVLSVNREDNATYFELLL